MPSKIVEHPSPRVGERCPRVREPYAWAWEPCLFVRERCALVGEQCRFVREHCLLGRRPYLFRGTLSELSERRDALAAVRMGLPEVRRVLGPVHGDRSDELTRKETTCPQSPSPPFVVWVSHW
jgi:hypothetical protein